MIGIIALVVAVLGTITVSVINHRYEVILQDKRAKAIKTYNDEESLIIDSYLEQVRINKGDLFKYKVEKKEEE